MFLASILKKLVVFFDGLLVFRILKEVQAEHEKFGSIHKGLTSKKACSKVSALPD